MHGGSSPQALKKARQRLDSAADQLARWLLDIAQSAESEAVRLAAIRDALDRIGLTGKQKLEVEVGMAPWETIASRIFVDVKALETYEDAVIVEDDADLPPETPMDTGRR